MLLSALQIMSGLMPCSQRREHTLQLDDRCLKPEHKVPALKSSLCLTCPNHRLPPCCRLGFSPSSALRFLHHLHFLQQVAPESQGGGRENPAPPLTGSKDQLPGMQNDGIDCRRVDTTTVKSQVKGIGISL